MLRQLLHRQNISLPKMAPPVASYVPARRHGDLVYISGQLPFADGKLILTGSLDSESNIEEAQAAMRQCFLNGLAAASQVVDTDQISGVLRLGAYVSSAPDFTEQHLVANGASDLAQSLLGEAGRHCRSAIGVPSLPLDAAVELDLILTLHP